MHGTGAMYTTSSRRDPTDIQQVLVWDHPLHDGSILRTIGATGWMVNIIHGQIGSYTSPTGRYIRKAEDLPENMRWITEVALQGIG